jgi:hypothetical protein
VTSGTPRALPPLIWLAGGTLGAIAGVAVAAPPAWLASAAGVVALAALLARSAVRSELVVAAYWLAFALFSTFLTGVVIAGMFYPFYLAFVLAAVLIWILSGLRVHPLVAWTYVGLLFVQVLSLIGYTGSIGGEALEQLIMVPFGALVLLQFRSPDGLRPVALAALLSSLAVAVWVIVSAVQGDFAYRGNVDVNENVVSFYVGLGFVVALAERLHGGRRWGAPATAAVVVAMGVTGYALVLLASRGMILGLVLAAGALLVRVAILDRARLGVFVLLALVASTGLLLPGGQGLLERFEDPSTATGGGRLQIWATLGHELARAGPTELLLGHGFEASRIVVARNFASLDSTHNAYLKVLYDMGVVGLALFLTLHAFVVERSWRIPGRDGALALALVVFLLGSNLFMSTPDNFLYWTALGFALAVATWGPGGAAARGAGAA